jgi:hypothetical protein
MVRRGLPGAAYSSGAVAARKRVRRLSSVSSSVWLKVSKRLSAVRAARRFAASNAAYPLSVSVRSATRRSAADVVLDR